MANHANGGTGRPRSWEDTHKAPSLTIRAMSEQRLMALEEKSMELERQVEQLDESLRGMSADLTAVRRELARMLELFQAVTKQDEEQA